MNLKEDLNVYNKEKIKAVESNTTLKLNLLKCSVGSFRKIDYEPPRISMGWNGSRSH